ncbi:uncharacterized protein HKW66_Vig0225890 [Vigna angularis]|uniref:Uncharacterized protein n=1 Tax=Phaseolus angularis TaxID=3914 RepID=A0A8T0JYQ0_PHAAN|nr:uncharacterized protein HKW66_Vig0225890 [Vigna angularis]
MAASMKQMSLIVSFLGVVSFVLGVLAENKKPAAGIPVTGLNGASVTCKYPADRTVVLGYLSVAFLVASTVVGFTAGLAAALLLWPTITEQLHLTHNVHHDVNYECPTAKTGLLGGGAFLSLDSSLLWLIALMLAGNAREDFFEEESNGVEKGEYGTASSDNYYDADSGLKESS